MTDPTLRLPATTFHAVLDLGELPISRPSLPALFTDPSLDVGWHDEAGTSVATFYVEFTDGQLHAETSGGRFEYHFHDAVGDDT